MGHRQLAFVRIILGGLGVTIWGYGYRTDDPTIRLVGMATLLVVLLMRWVPKGSLDR